MCQAPYRWYRHLYTVSGWSVGWFHIPWQSSCVTGKHCCDGGEIFLHVIIVNEMLHMCYWYRWYWYFVPVLRVNNGSLTAVDWIYILCCEAWSEIMCSTKGFYKLLRPPQIIETSPYNTTAFHITANLIICLAGRVLLISVIWLLFWLVVHFCRIIISVGGEWVITEYDGTCNLIMCLLCVQV